MFINKGVQQGDTIFSPRLFTVCLENIFTNIQWEDKGLNIDEENLDHLKFADDIILIAANWKDAEVMLKESAKFGLKINISKTNKDEK